MTRTAGQLLSLFCLIFIITQPDSLQAGEHNKIPCCTQKACPPPKLACKGSVEKETVSRHCWDVECDYVCIPPVKFPWTKCCDLPCPKIRKIHVMKRRDYKIDICKFHWKLKKIWPCCDDPITR